MLVERVIKISGMNSRTNSTQPNRPRNTNRATTRLSQKQKLLIGGAISTLLIVLIVIVYQSTKPTTVKAAVAGEYRSKASGNWSTLATWEKYNGSAWLAATTAPVASDNIITIQNGHTVTVTANVSADQIVIESGGRLNVNASRTLTIANGTGTDLINNGTVGNTGVISLGSGSTIAHAAGGTYIHSQNAGTIPTATWSATSNCNITGVTSTMPANIAQNFGNLTWSCASQGANMAFNQNMNIQGTFTVTSTGSRYLGLTNNTTSRTFSIAGNLNQTGGDFRATNSSGGGTITVSGDLNLSGSTSSWFTLTSGSGACNMTINGNLNISNGVFWTNEDVNACTLTINGDFNLTDGIFIGTDNSGAATVNLGGNLNISGNTATSYCILTSGSGAATANVSGNVSVTGGNLLLTESTNNGNLNVTGNYTYTGGFVWEDAAATIGVITFNGSAMQTCISTTDIFNTVNFVINNNAYVQMATGSDYLNGSGSFTLSSGGKLGIRSADGISASGTNGHIRVTGSRSYNTAADYIYNGSAAQVSGDGLPSTTRNLTIDNASGVTLSNSTGASGTLSFVTGNVITYTNTLSLGTSSSVLGTLSRTSGHVVGNFRRWVDNTAASGVVFPVGTNTIYNGISMDFTAAPSAGTITASFSTGFPGVYGLPIIDAGDNCSTIGSGWWTMSGGDGFGGGTYNIAAIAEGFSGITDYTLLHLFRRDNNGSVWKATGTHAAPGGNATVPVVNRQAVSALGEFGIASTGANPLPVKLTRFEVKAQNGTAVIYWSTESEHNSDYFVVERSKDGSQYSDLKMTDAAGNSTVTKNYSITDPSPYQGGSYYRLRQVDFNGQKEYFGPKYFHLGTSGVATALPYSSINASPNPFLTDLSLNFTSDVEGKCPMIITNTNGQVMYKGMLDVEKGKNVISLPLASQLLPGTYVITLGEGKDRISTRVVKK